MTGRVYGETKVMQDGATGTGNGVTFNVQGLATLCIQLSGTMTSLTVTFEATADNTNWKAVQVVNLSTGALSTTSTAAGLFVVPCASLSQVRARVSTYGSGAVTATGLGSVAAGGAALGDIDIQANETVILGAGSALAGEFGIDQTTPGTTNRVVSGGTKVRLTQTPTIDTSIYADGDALGGLLTFANAVRAGVLTGTVTEVQILDHDQELASIVLELFDRTFTATADQAAWDPSDADMANHLGSVFVASGAYSDNNDNAAATVLDQPLDVVLLGTSLFGQLKVKGTPTWTAATDISVILTIRQD